MSHTGGGLAQMSFQGNNPFDQGLGMPGSGFASRRGANEVFNNRLSMAPPSNISTIQEHQDSMGHTPRTSRSHMLAGLRTAPKSATYPGSAPPGQVQNISGHQTQNARQNTLPGMPQTAYGSGFGNAQRGRIQGGSMYGLPEILAPPELQYEQEHELANMNPQEYNLLMQQAQQLAQQQAMLQQQLRQLTLAQQQMPTLRVNGNMNQQQQYMQAQMPGAGSLYNQQLQTGMQPVVSPVPGTPGLYSIFNPITGQQKFMFNEEEQMQAQQTQQTQQTQIINNELSHSPPPTTPTFHAQVSPPPGSNAPVQTFRSPSPPKSRSPPVEVNPLPPPSNTAFRRGHTKQLSSVTGNANTPEGFKNMLPRTASFPLTPQTGTFGPGQSRAGEHPMRQPRGPPSFEELKDKPTSKHSGSKNFVTRQRRRALNSLVRAGVERRGTSRGSNSIDSPGSGTPSSEVEITFSVSSESDDDSGRSSRGSIHGAIGAERKAIKEHSRERKSNGAALTTASLSSEEGTGGKMVEDKVDEIKSQRPANPMLVLTSATEKRRSAIF